MAAHDIATQAYERPCMTAAMLGGVPLIGINSKLAGLTTTISPWSPAAAFVGLMLAWFDWYIRRLGKRVQNGI